jgi:hypothetical protein
MQERKLTSIHLNSNNQNSPLNFFVSIFSLTKKHSFHTQNRPWWHLGILKYPTSKSRRMLYEKFKSNSSHMLVEEVNYPAFLNQLPSFPFSYLHFWMCSYLSTLSFCLLQSSNKFSFFLRGVWLTNPNGIPLNETQLFSFREIHSFKNSCRLHLTKPGVI